MNAFSRKGANAALEIVLCTGLMLIAGLALTGCPDDPPSTPAPRPNACQPGGPAVPAGTTCADYCSSPAGCRICCNNSGNPVGCLTACDNMIGLEPVDPISFASSEVVQTLQSSGLYGDARMSVNGLTSDQHAQVVTMLSKLSASDWDFVNTMIVKALPTYERALQRTARRMNLNTNNPTHRQLIYWMWFNHFMATRW